jgi:hypothetical protein
MEEDKDTPTVRKLYEIIMEMSIKYKKMEEKLEELSKYVDTKKKKINIIEWLNTTCKSSDPCKTSAPFELWMKKIKVERKHLESIFSHDYVYGALHVLKDFNNEHIRCYDQKDDTLFIFTNEIVTTNEVVTNEVVTNEVVTNEVVTNEIVTTTETATATWSEMKPQQFDKMMDFISKQFLHEFVLWQNENKHRMEDDNYAMTYMINIKKMNGGNNTTTEQLYRKIHREVYKQMKTRINIEQHVIV